MCFWKIDQFSMSQEKINTVKGKELDLFLFLPLKFNCLNNYRLIIYDSVGFRWLCAPGKNASKGNT